jgi:hypothetical protein
LEVQQKQEVDKLLRLAEAAGQSARPEDMYISEEMTRREARLAAIAHAILLDGATSAELPENDGNIHMDVATCAASQCHGSAVPREGSSVLQNEYVTWTQDDPHSLAYEVLSNSRSRGIAARLGLGSATTAKICLDCHADNVPAQLRGERFHLSDGVGCEACHGGAENWLATHYNQPTVTHAANLEAGLYPTESVAERGELCLSCHLGTRDNFTTHRIMAAGHPRLAFELDTFTELWRTLVASHTIESMQITASAKAQ